MQILKTKGWEGYSLLDSGNSMRLERFGFYTIVRPDPQAIWKTHLPTSSWEKADAIFEKTSANTGKWIRKENMPEQWLIPYKNLSFWARLTPFKHTGIFPEQIIQWEWITENITKANRPIKVLNLFAYTGIASIIAANAGAYVTHLDASKPSIAWAKENQTASKLNNKPIRWILDDAIKFVGREIKRGVTYDGILMDPPIYGHGPTGEIWSFNESFPKLLSLCKQVLTKQPLFLLVNAYAISASSLMLQNMLEDITTNLEGTIEVGELALEEENSQRLLSTGIFGRWSGY